jgi:hypothetical protein
MGRVATPPRSLHGATHSYQRPEAFQSVVPSGRTARGAAGAPRRGAGRAARDTSRRTCSPRFYGGWVLWRPSSCTPPGCALLLPISFRWCVARATNHRLPSNHPSGVGHHGSAVLREEPSASFSQRVKDHVNGIGFLPRIVSLFGAWEVPRLPTRPPARDDRFVRLP